MRGDQRDLPDPRVQAPDLAPLERTETPRRQLQAALGQQHAGVPLPARHRHLHVMRREPTARPRRATALAPRQAGHWASSANNCLLQSSRSKTTIICGSAPCHWVRSGPSASKRALAAQFQQQGVPQGLLQAAVDIDVQAQEGLPAERVHPVAGGRQQAQLLVADEVPRQASLPAVGLHVAGEADRRGDLRIALHPVRGQGRVPTVRFASSIDRSDCWLERELANGSTCRWGRGLGNALDIEGSCSACNRPASRCYHQTNLTGSSRTC